MNVENDNNMNKIPGIYAALVEFSRILTKANDWIQSNISNIVSLVLGLAEISNYSKAVQICASFQVVLSDYLPSDTISEICRAEDPKQVVKDYYSQYDGYHLRQLFEECLNSDYLKDNIMLLGECYLAYQNKMYLLCCSGLFALADGLITEITNNQSIRFDSRLKGYKKSLEESSCMRLDVEWIFAIEGLELVQDSVWGYASFQEDPEDVINRNRLLHGRTKRDYNTFDVTKALLIVRAIAHLREQKQVILNSEQ